ncbi:STM4013/SEN3800 family hydrolase [Anatilimnocola floriformis]|uniref:STM4013/SEN3800 family hydrolase n=1 Tax=Anatilimnocola floriformis TaxID=2948575 RepID=UPI0020C1EFF6|nr:STM4013/SEN3800 family hydrolase [Anatilimnocola floriformis]
MINVRQLIPSHDVVLITLDTLRYDVAEQANNAGKTPFLTSLLPGGHWEQRHSPGNFTFAAHQGFFAGFLPTPATPGKHARLFAARFPGSETTSEQTFVFEEANLVHGLAARGYHTICIGGVGFFNRLSPLGCVLPDLFQESHWSEELGVTSRHSTERQVALACERLRALDNSQRAFLFINISALHQPNCIFAPPAQEDSPATQAAALAYVDRQLPPLFDLLAQRGPSLCILTSDHGTAYGEAGYWGHRLAHECVWNVPYAEFVHSARDL